MQEKSTGLQSVERTMAIISLLAKSKTPLSVIEISRALNINRTTAYGIINTLMLDKYLEKDSLSNKYTVGPRLYEIGMSFRYRLPCMPVLERLAVKLVEKWHLSVHLGVDNGSGKVLFLLLQLPVDRQHFPLGDVAPMYATGIGKILLAAMPDAALAQLLDKTELRKQTLKTIADRQQLLAEIAAIRANGYASDDEEYVEGLACIAVPIRDFTGKTVAGVSINGPAARVNKLKDALTEEMILTGKKISLELGWGAE